jgi:hypothetical protein
MDLAAAILKVRLHVRTTGHENFDLFFTVLVTDIQKLIWKNVMEYIHTF